MLFNEWIQLKGKKRSLPVLFLILKNNMHHWWNIKHRTRTSFAVLTWMQTDNFMQVKTKQTVAKQLFSPSVLAFWVSWLFCHQVYQRCITEKNKSGWSEIKLALNVWDEYWKKKKTLTYSKDYIKVKRKLSMKDMTAWKHACGRGEKACTYVDMYATG